MKEIGAEEIRNGKVFLFRKDGRARNMYQGKNGEIFEETMWLSGEMHWVPHRDDEEILKIIRYIDKGF